MTENLVLKTRFLVFLLVWTSTCQQQLVSETTEPLEGSKIICSQETVQALTALYRSTNGTGWICGSPRRSACDVPRLLSYPPRSILARRHVPTQSRLDHTKGMAAQQPHMQSLIRTGTRRLGLSSGGPAPSEQTPLSSPSVRGRAMVWHLFCAWALSASISDALVSCRSPLRLVR